MAERMSVAGETEVEVDRGRGDVGQLAMCRGRWCALISSRSLDYITPNYKLNNKLVIWFTSNQSLLRQSKFWGASFESNLCEFLSFKFILRLQHSWQSAKVQSKCWTICRYWRLFFVSFSLCWLTKVICQALPRIWFSCLFSGLSLTP